MKKTTTTTTIIYDNENRIVKEVVEVIEEDDIEIIPIVTPIRRDSTGDWDWYAYDRVTCEGMATSCGELTTTTITIDDIDEETLKKIYNSQAEYDYYFKNK